MWTNRERNRTAWLRGMTRQYVILSSVLVLSGIAACKSSVTGGNGGAGGVDGAGGAGGTGGAPAGAVCPVDQPNADDPCTIEGLLCTYGDSPRTECRPQATCINGAFTVALAKCAVPPAGTCTTSPEPGVECPGAAEGGICTYDDGTICVCSSCSLGPCGPPPPHFSCAPPPANCPTIAPNAGSACSMEGASCIYGFPCGPSGVNAECKGGAWVWTTEVACPQ